MIDGKVWVAVITHCYDGEDGVAGCCVFRTEEAATAFATTWQGQSDTFSSVEIHAAEIEGEAIAPKDVGYALSVYGTNPFNIA